MTRRQLTKAETHDLVADGIIEILTKVESKYSGKQDAPAITAALTQLKANRHDKVVLTEALAYCTDGWVLGPIN